MTAGKTRLALAGTRIGLRLRRLAAVGRAAWFGRRAGRLAVARRGPLILVLDLPVRRAVRGGGRLAVDRGHGEGTSGGAVRSVWLGCNKARLPGPCARTHLSGARRFSLFPGPSAARYGRRRASRRHGSSPRGRGRRTLDRGDFYLSNPLPSRKRQRAACPADATLLNGAALATGHGAPRLRSLPARCLSPDVRRPERAVGPQECSSAGRASVSKTEGRGFESLHSCHYMFPTGRSLARS